MRPPKQNTNRVAKLYVERFNCLLVIFLVELKLMRINLKKVRIVLSYLHISLFCSNVILYFLFVINVFLVADIFVRFLHYDVRPTSKHINKHISKYLHLYIKVFTSLHLYIKIFTSLHHTFQDIYRHKLTFMASTYECFILIKIC